MELGRRLLSQSTTIFAARIFGAGITFLAQAAIARFWGAELLGEYLLIIATVNIIAVIMPLGFETTGTYFAAEYRAKGEGRLLRGFMGRAYFHVVVTGTIVLALGYLVAADDRRVRTGAAGPLAAGLPDGPCHRGCVYQQRRAGWLEETVCRVPG